MWSFFILSSVLLSGVNCSPALECYQCAGFDPNEHGDDWNTKSCTDQDLNVTDLQKHNVTLPEEQLSTHYLSCITIATSEAENYDGKPYFWRQGAILPLDRQAGDKTLPSSPRQSLGDAGLLSLDIHNTPHIKVVRECNTDLCNGVVLEPPGPISLPKTMARQKSPNAKLSLNCYFCQGYNASDPSNNVNNTKSCTDAALNVNDMDKRTVTMPEADVYTDTLSCFTVSITEGGGANDSLTVFTRYGGVLQSSDRSRYGSSRVFTNPSPREGGRLLTGNDSTPRATVTYECNYDLCNGAIVEPQPITAATTPTPDTTTTPETTAKSTSKVPSTTTAPFTTTGPSTTTGGAAAGYASCILVVSFGFVLMFH